MYVTTNRLAPRTDCPSVRTHSDYQDYELTLLPIFEQCCPEIAVQGLVVNCPAVDEENYVFKSYPPQEGDCCKQYVALLAKLGNKFTRLAKLAIT
ncbi:unnamed protein product [Acanthoscelides obtectus]|uniref:Uncharacterized protein n=1 Tax=Acanthoscelides obtectus TaxID=200917 RepID=A0A9P0M5X8_ACAOB|nr:unnamed protein product [Acanthoscelides obtectus]CAK1626694.1 hypothetical protein AOBTE_LOCUS4036 [Acanthoscelides obtectus]